MSLKNDFVKKMDQSLFKIDKNKTTFDLKKSKQKTVESKLKCLINIYFK